MALVDPTTEQLVVRIVYDGPAYAGKTTSLRALAGSLGSDAFSAGEEEGRTLYFDWVDYVGGRFEGLPIRCQIVSVPGQQVWTRRRRLLLETADAVVFVADSRRTALEENRRALKLLEEVQGAALPPFAIVVQANKRDLPGAMSLDELGSALESARPLAMTEAIAERGEGIRETFVFAVRLALDRVRELWASRSLPSLAPEVATAEELLQAMQTREAHALPSLVSPGFGAADRREEIESLERNAQPPTEPDSESTRLPADSAVPPGLIWPPVEGRVIVHEAMRSAIRLQRSRGGDWVAVSQEWKLRSASTASFGDVESGRDALVGWARWHSAAADLLSPQRSVALAPERPQVEPASGPSAWRLWQIVRRVRSLAEDCHEILAQPDDGLVGEGLLRVAELRLRAESVLRRGGWLRRLNLRSVGASPSGQPVFVGFAPYLVEPPSPDATADGGALSHGAALEILRAELGPLLRRELALTPQRVTHVLTGLRRAATPSRAGLAQALQSLLLGS